MMCYVQGKCDESGEKSGGSEEEEENKPKQMKGRRPKVLYSILI